MEVKIARIRKGMTQKKLRELLKISPVKMVAIERGHYEKISIPLAKKLAALLGTSVNELFFND